MLNVCTCAQMCVCVWVCVIAVTRQDVEKSAVHVVKALERTTYGPQRGGMKEKQKGGREMRRRVSRGACVVCVCVSVCEFTLFYCLRSREHHRDIGVSRCICFIDFTLYPRSQVCRIRIMALHTVQNVIHLVTKQKMFHWAVLISWVLF